MLCSLWHGLPSSRHFFRAAMALWDRCVEHQMAPVLPRPYLEEIASHLLAAWRDYQPVIGADPDLASSENAFVAHFTALQDTDHRPGSFEEYLASFGLDRRLAVARDFYYARDALMGHLEKMFIRYGIMILDYHPSVVARKQAQELLAWRFEDLAAYDRPRVLLQHDEWVLATLIDEDAAHAAVWVLCTWDRLLRNIQGLPLSAPVVDPLSLADLLGLVVGETTETRLCTPPIVALALGTEAQERGARVLDILVKLEREQLSDARVSDQILKFKREYVQRLRQDVRGAQVRHAWDQWRLRALGEARPNRAPEESM